MRPLVKPLVAVVALSLATSTAFAAMGAGKTASKAASCGPVVNTDLDRLLNPNSPTREVDTCWGERYAFGGNVRFTYENVTDPFDTSVTADNFMNVRSAFLVTDVMVNKMATLHFALGADSQLSNNMLQSGFTIGSYNIDTNAGAESLYVFSLEEAYVVLSDFAKAPVYAKLGKGYTPFGYYKDAKPSVYSLNQSLVQGNATTATLGFASKAGYDLSVTLFENESTDDWDQTIFRFETAQSFKGTEFGFTASYVDNLTAMNGAAANESFTNANVNTSAYDIALGAKMRDFSLGLEYFAVDKTMLSSGNDTNAKPSVFSIAGKYDFVASGKKGNVHVGYEKSSDAGSIASNNNNIAHSGPGWTALPESHTALGFTFELDKGLDLNIDMHNFASYTSGTDDQVQYVAELVLNF